MPLIAPVPSEVRLALAGVATASTNTPTVWFGANPAPVTVTTPPGETGLGVIEVRLGCGPTSRVDWARSVPGQGIVATRQAVRMLGPLASPEGRVMVPLMLPEPSTSSIAKDVAAPSMKKCAAVPVVYPVPLTCTMSPDATGWGVTTTRVGGEAPWAGRVHRSTTSAAAYASPHRIKIPRVRIVAVTVPAPVLIEATRWPTQPSRPLPTAPLVGVTGGIAAGGAGVR